MAQSEVGWFISTIRPYKKSVALILCAAVILSLTGVSIPWFIQQLVDKATMGVMDWRLGIILAGVLIVDAMPLTYLKREKMANQYHFEMQGNLFQHLLRMDMSFYDDRGSTVVASKVGDGASAARTLLTIFCNGALIIHIPVAVFSGYYILQYSTLAFAILVVYMITFAIAGKFVGDRVSKVGGELRDLDNDLLHRRREAIHHIPTIKVHNAERRELVNYWTKGKSALLLRNTLTYLHATFYSFSQFSTVVATAVMVFVMLPQVVDGSLTAGTFMALMLYGTQLTAPALFLGDLYSDIKRNFVLLSPVIEILSVEPQVIEQKNPLELNPLRQGIVIDHVSFKYPDKNECVLKDISLFIPSAKKTAIVGSSGSGKTTLVKLLTRLYDPTEGVITYDGTDVRNVSLESLYRNVAYLSQEIPLFTGTIRENVAFGMDSYEECDIYEALEYSSARFVGNNAEGIDLKIGELGKILSGGEKQRVALARIFMRKPDIIILDEATASLDNITEASVHNAFEDISKMNGGKTMIVIAHRLSTVRDADQIIVMNEGRVLDVGNHTELMSRCFHYQELNKNFAA